MPAGTTSTGGATFVSSVGGANAIGKVTPDFTGSADEWEDMVIADLIKNFKTGKGGLGGYGDPSIGVPNQSDFGTPETPLSYQTVNYWENYVRKFGANDPWIIEQYGGKPDRRASFVDDPNSASSVQGTWEERNAAAAAEAEKDRAWESGENALDRGLERESIAAANARAAAEQAGMTQRTQMQIDAEWGIARMQDATDRFIAEGEWGVQKWVTTENNTAAMARLQAQLGFDREALAQQAISEKNRHHEQMVGLALEVAKYDAELAASPRNWLKYAGWLKTRDIVINGMTLAMAAQEVPEEQITPETVAAGTGSNVAGYQTAQEMMQPGNTVTPEQDRTYKEALAQAQAQQGASASPFTTTGQQQSTLTPMQPPPSPEELANTTDYAGLARNLLGMNPAAASADEASPDKLAAISQGLRTSGGQRIAGFGAGNMPTTNALGMPISEVMGKDVNYKQFSNLLPTEQAMKVGEVESIRGSAGVSDWIGEMERSRPKGGGSTLSWG